MLDEDLNATDAMMDAIAQRFRKGWVRGERPKIEDYLSECTPDLQSQLLPRLLALELESKSQLKESPSRQEYDARFPGQSGLVSQAFLSDFAATLDLASENTLELRQSLDTIGRYHVEEIAGAGAFGIVFRAYDADLKRTVAIKVPRFAQDESALNEARRIANLDVPGILPIYDVGRLPDGRCYFVSKFIVGSNLAARFAAKNLSIPDLVRMITDVATALHQAHLTGVVHRDSKPANILIDANNQPYVADFGLAVGEAEQAGMAGKVAGTLPYMAPEQVRGETHHLDGRADLWSLGVVLYEGLTGRRPFAGETVSGLAEEICCRAPKPLRMIDDRIPSQLERITLKCLNRDVSARYGTARDLAADLQLWMDGNRPSQRSLRVPNRPGDRPSLFPTGRGTGQSRKV